jgi:regulatory protein
VIYGGDDEVSGPVGDWETLTRGPEYYTVTKMTPGVRDHNRVNIFLDGHFAFSLDVTQVVESGVKIGYKVTTERLGELQRLSEFGKLYQRTLEWVLTRPHSVRETRDYLRRRQIKRRMLNRQRVREEKKPLAEIEDDVMQLVIERLIAKKYLNDQKFAEFYAENRYVRRGISHKRLRMELQKKGVTSDIISEAMSKVGRDENEEILKVIAKKRKKYNDFQLIGYLVRQGFNLQQAKEAVELAKAQED